MSSDIGIAVLATGIYTLRHDCNNLEDYQLIISNTMDLIHIQGGTKRLVELLDEDLDCPIPLLAVSREDVIIFALLCIALFHKDGCDVSWATRYIRSSAAASLNGPVKIAAEITLAILGEPTARREQQDVMNCLGVCSQEEYESKAICGLISYLADGSHK
jgi:hypothetical protein